MFNYFILLVFYSATVSAKIYFKEEFNDDDWQKRWFISQHPSKSWGTFILTPGRYYGDPVISKGIQTSEDNKFYALTTEFEPFSNENKVLVIQYTVKFEQDIKCGGSYIKIFDCNFDPKRFHSYKPYLILFGPDICTYKKVHVIFNYMGRKLEMKQQLKCKHDQLTHLYTLIIKPDNSYLIKIDNKVERRGILDEDWDFLPPRMIKDRKVTKPLHSNETLKNIDIKEEKPQDKNYTDPELHFIGEEQDENDIKTARIKNQTNQKEWKLKKNDTSINRGQVIETFNENSVHHSYFDFYKYDEICGIGFDLWQVESGTLFDNILITDDEIEAEKHGNDTWGVIKEEEKIMKIKFDRLTGKKTKSYHDHYHDEL